MQRARPASEASMDEILASIRKIIADDTVPGPGGMPAGRIEPKLTAPDPIATDKAQQPDRRIASSIDRDLADLLNDPAPVPAAAPPAAASSPADQRLPKPGWLTGGAPLPTAAPAPGPAAPANGGRPLPLAAKLEQARSEPLPAPRAPAAPFTPPAGIAKPPSGPLPTPSRAVEVPAGAPDASSAPQEVAAAVVQAREPSVAKPEAPAKPAVEKRAEPPASPALAALASFAQQKSSAPQVAPVDAAPTRVDAPVSTEPPRAPAPVAAIAPDPSETEPPSAPMAAASKPAAAVPVLSAEALVAALPSSRPPTAAGAATVRSVEDLIADLLRPMLRQWLDENMPRIVEKALRIELAQGLKLPTLPVTGKVDKA